MVHRETGPYVRMGMALDSTLLFPAPPEPGAANRL